jgi:hypothetical protein
MERKRETPWISPSELSGALSVILSKRDGRIFGLLAPFVNRTLEIKQISNL